LKLPAIPTTPEPLTTVELPTIPTTPEPLTTVELPAIPTTPLISGDMLCQSEFWYVLFFHAIQ